MPKSGSSSGTALSINFEPSGLIGAKTPSQAKLKIMSAIKLSDAANRNF
jgi:hypothetical protein